MSKFLWELQRMPPNGMYHVEVFSRLTRHEDQRMKS